VESRGRKSERVKELKEEISKFTVGREER